MATRKSVKIVKKAPVMGNAKAATAKKANAAKKSAIDPNRKIKGYKGMDEFFYPSFPRFAAYELLCKAPKQTMTVKNFLAKVRALKGVETPAQANGILQKLVDKKRHVGAVCASLV